MDGKVRFLIHIAYWGALAALLLLFALFVFPKILPFVIGFAVAAAVNPLVTRWSRRRSRWFASLALILPLWGALLFLCWRLGSLVYREAGEMLEGLRRINIEEWIAALPVLSRDPVLRETVVTWVSKQVPTFLDLSQDLLLRLINLIMKLPDAFLFCFSTVVSSLLISVCYPTLEPFLLRQFSARIQAEYFDIKTFLSKTIVRVTRAYLILFLLNYVLLSVGLSLLRTAYPLILAALIAMLDLLPLIGTATVLIPWGLADIFLLSRPGEGIGLIVLAGIVTLVRELLQPKIVGKQIGLSPLSTLIAIYVGLKTCGFLGVILFPLAFLFLKEWNGTGRILLWKNPPD